MEFILQPSELFLEQLDELSEDTKRILEKRFLLIKQNPFRNKRVVGYNLFLFRIRFEDGHKEKRVIYLVGKPYSKSHYFKNIFVRFARLVNRSIKVPSFLRFTIMLRSSAF